MPLVAVEEEEAGERGEVASEVALSEVVAEAYEPPAAEPEPLAEAHPDVSAPVPAAPVASQAQPEPESERSPTAYNVSPPHEVSGPPTNPRRGWWRRR